MNLGTRSPNDIRSVHFNQDVSCIAVAYGSGYCIFTLDPFVAVLKINNGGSIGIASLLYSTSLVALTGSGELPSHSTRRLQLVNTKRLSTICELTFPTSILAIRMNRRRLTVVLEEQLYIYDITKMELKNVVETVPNPQALIAMSYSEENSYIAYPARSPLPPGTMDTNPADDDGSHGGGSVAIFDAINCVPISIISAHKASLSAIALSSDGTLLATASEKGTIIRVFGVPNGERKFAFRRGTYSTKIHSMAFSHDNSLLAVTS
ncbi:WD40 repeat-like protein [Ramicandelaber brevisporus]|nr:WD40 repeat-like protein [Ramicandelaber brevisporus]